MISADFLLSHIKGRVHEIHIFLIQFLPEQLHGFPESLEMYDLPLPEELDHVIHIGIIGKTENIVVGDPCFLLRYVLPYTTGNPGQFGRKGCSFGCFRPAISQEALQERHIPREIFPVSRQKAQEEKTWVIRSKIIPNHFAALSLNRSILREIIFGKGKTAASAA